MVWVKNNTMPPQATSNFGGMAEKVMKTAPPREQLEAAAGGVAKRAPWKSSRKSSSKVMPKEPSPKQASAEKAPIRKSKSAASTPTKEPLKSCLKKPSDTTHKLSVASSPPLSHRSECTQLSMRSEFTESVFEQSEETPGTPKSVEFAHHHQEMPPTWSATPSIVDETPDTNSDHHADPDLNVPRRREIPVSFVEAFSRDENSVADSPHMGPYLLKLAKSYASGENPVKALEYCIRAVKFYERQDKTALDFVISLHVLAELHCHLGQYEDAVSLLQRSVAIPDLENGGEEHALASFSGHMQLGDTLCMAGKLAPSLQSYHRALEIQKSVLGEFDTRVAETCTYIAEAHVQVIHPLQFSFHAQFRVISLFILHGMTLTLDFAGTGIC